MNKKLKHSNSYLIIVIFQKLRKGDEKEECRLGDRDHTLNDDNGNGYPDECENDLPFVQLQEIRIDQPSSDEDEYFEDQGNGIYDQEELFIDEANGIYDEGEIF